MNAEAGSAGAPERGGLFGSLRVRILIGMAFVALIPLLVMAYQGYHCARQAIVMQQENHLQAVLASRKARLSDWLEERRSDMRFLAATPCARSGCAGGCTVHAGGDAEVAGGDAEVAGGDAEVAGKDAGPQDAGQPASTCSCNLLDTFRDRSASYEIIATYDLEWNFLDQSRRPSCPRETLLDSPFAEELAAADGLTVGLPGLFCDGRICVEMGHPLLDMEGKRIGYIVACLNLSRAIDPILQDHAGLGETGKTYLVSPEGKFQSQPLAGDSLLGERAVLPEGMLPGAGQSEPSAAGGAVVEYVDFRGEAVLGALAEFPGMPFSIVAEIDQAEAFRPLGVLKTRALVTGLVTLVIALLISLRVAGRLSFPLKELAAVASRISAGRHGERLGPMDGTEAREVAAAFNSMLDELAGAQRRLSHAAALAAIGELSTSMVHEIRNPLSSIKINIQALRRKVEGDSAHAELAEIAGRQVERVERMLNDLLQYGKALVLEPGAVTFSELVSDVLEVVGDKARDLGVRVSIEDGLGDAALVVDREQVGRALTNVVTNAVEAVGEDAAIVGEDAAIVGEDAEIAGSVTISGRPVPGKNDLFAIEVADSGPGIPEVVLPKLFMPFVTTRDEGTGLGLANVKKIAEYHGGTVRAENRGRGAAVTLTLPRRTAP